jgi:hypothetical protein
VARCLSLLSISHTCGAVAVQFFAVGGAQQLNDKNGKKLALKFPSASRFAAVISKLRTHLPGDDNLVRPSCSVVLPTHSFITAVLFHFLRRRAVCPLARCSYRRFISCERAAFSQRCSRLLSFCCRPHASCASLTLRLISDCKAAGCHGSVLLQQNQLRVRRRRAGAARARRQGSSNAAR